jgi:2,4-dienoyl-CoA reductase-like NADH-dependent reductase (Old Yellow Enzyme family)
MDDRLHVVRYTSILPHRHPVHIDMTSLFDPLNAGSLTLRNRIGMSALTRDRAIDTIPTDLMVEYYAQRAAGGAGLLVTEGVLISRQGFVHSARYALFRS